MPAKAIIDPDGYVSLTREVFLTLLSNPPLLKGAQDEANKRGITIDQAIASFAIQLTDSYLALLKTKLETSVTLQEI